MADCGISWHTHDPGIVLTHLAVAIADGTGYLVDIAALKEQEGALRPGGLGGHGPGEAVHARAVFELRAMLVALATARACVWAVQPPQGPMTWDFDSTCSASIRRRRTPRPTTPGLVGLPPDVLLRRRHRRALAGLLCPGNAGANTVADHLSVLDDAAAQLPAEVTLSHGVRDDESLVANPLVVRIQNG